MAIDAESARRSQIDRTSQTASAPRRKAADKNIVVMQEFGSLGMARRNLGAESRSKSLDEHLPPVKIP